MNVCAIRLAAARRLLGWTTVWIVALGLAAGAPAAAQEAAPQEAAERSANEPDSCSVWLAEAQMRYTEQEYGSVEALVLSCAYHPAALPGQLLNGYRLLTLAFIRQDLLHEAQTTVLKLLAVDFGYEPDAVQDPPFYVALVGSVKDQLRVEPPARSAARSPARPTPSTARVNVNTADAAALETVPGIGPVIAGRIVAYREQNGPFQRLEDLQGVSGIGPRTLERLTPHLVLEGGVQAFRAAGGVPVSGAPPPTARPATPAAMPATARLNLNTATAAELETLHGIGPALAGRIVAYRDEVGPFQRVEDVLSVRGIGPKTLARFADAVTVEAASNR